MSKTTEQIKDRLGIVDVVGQYLKLEKAGSNFKAKCPFHNEKTASFTVSPARNTFYCFGCNAKGDIFSFVEQFEGVDFMGALRQLADKAGVQIVKENVQKRDEHERLYTILEEATHFFEEQLKKSPKIREYILKRGLNDETIKGWQIGYVLPEWRSLYDRLTQKGFTDSEIEKVGLLKKTDSRAYDLFRGRIMFPLRDNSGRVIAFSGRIFEGDEKAPKYVNSPETTLFNKSKVLYGYDRAKLAIRKLNFSIIVEGQMDLLASHQAGYGNTVAVSGTALTESQLTFLKRLSNNIVLAFDSDNAGQRSSGRGADLALALGMDVKVVELPTGSDPADLIKKNKDDWRHAIRESKHIIDFYINTLSEQNTDKRKFKLEVQKVVIPYIAKISNTIDQAHFVSITAGRIGVPEESVWEEVKKASAQQAKDDFTYETPKSNTESEAIKSLTRKDSIEQNISTILLWQKTLKNPNIDIEKTEKHLGRVIGKKRMDDIFEVIKEKNKEKIIFELEAVYKNKEKLNKELKDLLLNLEKEQLEEKCSDLLEELRVVEGEGDSKKIEVIEKKYKKASDSLTDIKLTLLAE